MRTLSSVMQEPASRTSGHHAITLNKASALPLVLMLLGKGTQIPEHQATGPGPCTSVWIADLSGRRQAEKVGSGELIVLGSAIEHEVEALEESACLLTLAGVSQERREGRAKRIQ